MAWTEYGLISIDGPFTMDELGELRPWLDETQRQSLEELIRMRYLCVAASKEAHAVVASIEMRRRLQESR